MKYKVFDLLVQGINAAVQVAAGVAGPWNVVRPAASMLADSIRLLGAKLSESVSAFSGTANATRENRFTGVILGDFFYVSGDDIPGALFLRGLDPARCYGLRIFAARNDIEVRRTRFTVQGSTSATATVQASGAGAGSSGATTNDHEITAFSGVRPDAWGHVFIDVAIEKGSFAYISLLEIKVE